MMMLHGRRGGLYASSFSSSVCAALCASRREVHSSLSADRTYMETIQDAQHRFRWKDKHRFRPHQHFTYDPTSWSRPLEEKSKGDGARRVIDRLRYLREREEEQQQEQQHQETHEYPSSSTPVRNNIHEGNDDDNVDGGMPDYFYDVDATTTTTLCTDASAPRLTLQELVESADHYCSLIYAPRSSASSSSLRAHIHHVNALDEVLWHIFCRIQDGEVGTSFTWNALVISWRCLLMHPEATLHAIVRHYQASSSSSSSHQPPSTEMEAVPILYELIHRTLLQPLMCGNDFHLTTITSLEMCTELLFELSSPLVLKTSSEPLGQHLRTTLLPSLLQLCMDQLDHVAHTHHVDEEVNDLGRPEWVSSMHAEMLMRVLLRMSELNVAACEAAITTARWSELSYLLRGGASYVLAILQRSVRGGPLRQATSTALHRRSLDDDGDGGPPRGIKIAATDSCDVGALIRSTTSMLRAHTNTNHSPSLSKPMDDALHTMLDMLAWAPNYDVGAADAVDLLTQLTESMKMWSEEMMMINNNNNNNMLHGVRREERIRRSLVHCVLLGSRLAWSTSTNKVAMAECVLRLAEVAPHFDDKASRAEYLRLRGVAMQQALMNLTVDDFQEMMAERVNEKNTSSSSSSSSSMSWEELLANSSAASFAPLRLCVDAANCYFVRYNGTTTSWRTADVDDHHDTHVVCSASTAEALILLFSRQLRPRRNPSDTRWQVVSAATMPLISACVAVASGTPTASLHATVMDMQVNPDVWEEMLHTTHLAGDADVEALIAAARQHAENKRVSQRHTVVL